MGHVVVEGLLNMEQCSLSEVNLGPPQASLCSEEDGLPRCLLLDIGGEAFEELGILSLGDGPED